MDERKVWKEIICLLVVGRLVMLVVCVRSVWLIIKMCEKNVQKSIDGLKRLW